MSEEAWKIGQNHGWQHNNPPAPDPSKSSDYNNNVQNGYDAEKRRQEQQRQAEQQRREQGR